MDAVRTTKQSLTIKHRLYDILESSNNTSWAARWVNKGIFALILLNVLAVIIETVEPVRAQYVLAFRAFELFSITVFLVEYLTRVWIADLNPRYQSNRYPRLRYVFSFLGLVDLLAILPFFLPATTDLRFMRMFRLFRLLRVMKLSRYSRAMETISRIITSKKEELTIAVGAVLILLVIASVLIYALEHEAQPEVFSSIPATMWWGVATLTTIGYGDVYPITGLGKFFAAIVAILCIGTFALPAGIVAGGFAEEMHKQNHAAVCPHCGERMD